MIDNLLSGAGGVVVGTILGFVLSLSATWWQEGRKKREQKEAVCTLLYLEISQNLAWLEDFWQHRVLSPPGGASYEPEEIVFWRRANFVHELAPEWRHVMWESQVSNVPMALTRTQLQQVFDHHTKLARLMKLRPLLSEAFERTHMLSIYKSHLALPPERRPIIYDRSLTRAQASMPQQGHVTPLFLGVQIDDFNQITAELWEECEGIYNELHTSGNPLPAPKPAPTSANLLVRLKGRLPDKRQPKQH
ncbi:MAG TPA: hypothetical protein VKT82_20135 [Ktedonobacterales bacterium]|nr:hypothetical protein [Ktedonobacterales bacterium]